MYWFSLAKFPRSILNSLRSSIFTFLWGKSNGHQRYHLANWRTVSSPVKIGGWDIKNLEWFGISIRLKSMWKLLFANGIWSRIISHKYLKNRPLEDWIRAWNFIVIGTSYLWNGFIKILSWITYKLSWKVGDGMKIHLGVDPIAGLDASYSLPVDLRDYLTDYGITCLAQAQK